ncbi:hypothetical protein SDC9_192832 [bioreactor metagenome]|uniref:Uncharacterized protein n=1 Tax=bioreactor metagenome TaxID=1076179 RepID=A0A645I1W4_9ZZZZ
MLHMRNIKAVVKDAVSFRKCLIHVALAQHIVMGDVRARLGIKDREYLIGTKVGMNDRRIGLHALQRVGDGGQHLIFHLDELAGAPRNLRGIRGDGGDRLTAIAGLADREKVLILQIKPRALLVALSRDYAAHTRQGFRGGEIDREDVGMRVRASDDLRIERTGELDVVRKLGGARYLFDRIQAFNGLSYDVHF